MSARWLRFPCSSRGDPRGTIAARQALLPAHRLGPCFPGSTMNTSFRTAFAVLMIGGALVAAAAAPTSASGGAGATRDYVGTWITWFEAGRGPTSPCTRLYVAAESESTLDGMWTAPGWNGLLRGTVRQARAGLVWQGEWRSGETVGGFQLILGGPDAPAGRFKGTYTAAGAGDVRAWNGVREVEGQDTRVPCTWAD